MSDLASKVLQQIHTHQLIPHNTRVVVAVSGGPDSMALLHLLQRLSKSRGWILVVAHFNHKLRGAESQRDEDFVRDYAQKHQLANVFGAGDVAKLKEQSGESIEMAARQLRHRFLAKTAKDSGCTTIALGHHADDQVELFFLRLIRGAGTEGLAGMPWISPSPANPAVRLIRPLLGTSRANIQDYLQTHEVDHRLDSSNEDISLLRNRVRHRLLPLIQNAGFSLQKPILDACDILAADAAFVEESASHWRQAPEVVFNDLPCALQRSLLKKELIETGILPSFKKIEFLRKNPGKPLAVGKHGKLTRTGNGRIIVLSEKSASPKNSLEESSQKLLEITSGEGVAHFGSLILRWKTEASTVFESKRRQPQMEMFDADLIGKKAVLRHWRPGDRFHPIGLKKETKLQDLFTNALWNRSRRHETVLAESQNGVLFWVQGLRISEVFKITPTTKRILVWQWEELQDNAR